MESEDLGKILKFFASVFMKDKNAESKISVDNINPLRQFEIKKGESLMESIQVTERHEERLQGT